MQNCQVMPGRYQDVIKISPLFKTAFLNNSVFSSEIITVSDLQMRAEIIFRLADHSQTFILRKTALNNNPGSCFYSTGYICIFGSGAEHTSGPTEIPEIRWR